MKDKSAKKANIAVTFLRLLPVAYSSAPWWFWLTFVLSVAHGTSWGVLAIFNQRLFDSAASFAAGNTTMSVVFIELLILTAVYTTCQLLNGIGNFVPMVHGGIACGRMGKRISEKIGRLSPESFEDTDMLDHINKANQGKDNAFWFVFTILNMFMFYMPYFIAMGWYLFTVKPILALSIAIAFVPTAATQILRVKVFSKLEDQSAPIRRENEYYERCIVDREYFKETRLLGGFKFFKELYLDTLKLMNKLSYRANVKTNLTMLGMNMLTIAAYALILYMLFDGLMAREITVGAFAAIFGSLGLLFGIMNEIICGHMTRLANNMGTVQNYVEFLVLPERDGANKPIPKNSAITLENVTFAYPKAEKDVIKNVSLSIANGETIAIVGENGSGKSTLIRLITGLYLPKSGSVSFGEVNTRDMSMKSLYARTSAVFQKYQRYQMKLSDNITISMADEKADESTLDAIGEMAGFDKSAPQFTNGYDTMLSREFDGVDLSGGQWQRVAIGRGLYRTHDIIVLDEPTAAIDPIEETRIYNRFAEISKGKTAIIVTHRLGSVRLADRVVVMKEGEICECGTHDELMKADGEYARMYNSQQQWYAESAS